LPVRGSKNDDFHLILPGMSKSLYAELATLEQHLLSLSDACGMMISAS